MTRRYGAKKDANHGEIAAAFEKLGCCVADCSTLGGGIPDLVVGLPNLALVVMVEVKNPLTAYGRRGLNKYQTVFANSWTVHVVRNLDDVRLTVETLQKWRAAIVKDSLTVQSLDYGKEPF